MIAGWIGVVALAVCLVGGLVDKIVRVRRARSLPAPPPSVAPAPRSAVIDVRDVGAARQRVVDLRAVPWEALVGRAAVETMTAQFAKLAAPGGVIWVVGRQHAAKLDAMDQTAHILVWRRYTKLAPSAASHVLFVDGAPPPGPSARAAMEACGLTVALAWPTFVLDDGGRARTMSCAEVLASA